MEDRPLDVASLCVFSGKAEVEAIRQATMDRSDSYVTSVRIAIQLQTRTPSVADVSDSLIDARHKDVFGKRLEEKCLL